MGAEFTCALENQKPNREQTRTDKRLHTVQSKMGFFEAGRIE